MADIESLKSDVKKLNAKATQAKMDLHDLSEELPTNWQRIPEVAKIKGYNSGNSPVIIVGGGLYTLGAVVYAAKWPNPFPRTLGFHEVFHLLVVAAAIVQFVAVSLVVL